MTLRSNDLLEEPSHVRPPLGINHHAVDPPRHAPAVFILRLQYTPSDCGALCRLVWQRLHAPCCSRRTVYRTTSTNACHPGAIISLIQLQQQHSKAHCAPCQRFLCCRWPGPEDMGGVGCFPRPSPRMASQTLSLATPSHCPGRRSTPQLWQRDGPLEVRAARSGPALKQSRSLKQHSRLPLVAVDTPQLAVNPT